MCAFSIPPRHPGWREVSRSVVCYKRIHAFAANRFIDAKTPSAARFWRGVMNRCVGTKVDFVLNESFWKAMER